MGASNLKILGIVGARSGSKGILDKNIRPFAGKPLMGWIIQAAKASKYINRLTVSTDSEEYAKIARDFGAETPFLRPDKFAADTSTDLDFVRHAVEWFEKNENYKPDIIVRLLPTVPMQTAEDIDAAIEELIKDPEADSAVVIAEAIQPPLKALKLVDDGGGSKYLVHYFTGKGVDATSTLRQNFEKAYFRANTVVCRPRVLSTKTLTGEKVRYHIIPQERGVDIDSEFDFFIAEKLMEKFLN